MVCDVEHVMTARNGISGLAAIVVAIAVVAGACGSTDDEPAAGGPGTAGPGTEPATSATVVTTDPPPGGWIGDEPDFDAAGGVYEGAESEFSAADGEVLSAEVATDVVVAPVEPGGGVGDGAESLRDAVAWAWDTADAELWPLLRDMLERELLKHALAELDGNQSQVSERLGMVRNTVRKRMQDYGLD